MQKMDISDIINDIANDANCTLLSPDGIPVVGSDCFLPHDLREFYAGCGGLRLFQNEPFGFQIVSPKEFLPANPLLLGDFYLDHKTEYDAGRASKWYLLAWGKDPSQAITIDLGLQRNGYCYDSFWEVHATGNSKVVARSFTELIKLLYAARGTDLYWEHEGFDLGRAYPA